MRNKNHIRVKGLKSRAKWMNNVYRFSFDSGIKKPKWGIFNMSKLEFDELMFEKETKNFSRYSFGRILSSDEEVTGSVYVPKKARCIKITVEYDLPEKSI